MFYGQFRDAVEKAIQGLVSPIEKEFNVKEKGEPIYEHS